MSVERDLFGHPLKSESKRSGVRKIGYAAKLATGPKGQRCGTCSHAQAVTHKGRKSHKCEVVAMAWTPGEETDINLRAPACHHWERKPFVKKVA